MKKSENFMKIHGKNGKFRRKNLPTAYAYIFFINIPKKIPTYSKYFYQLSIFFTESLGEY